MTNLTLELLANATKEFQDAQKAMKYDMVNFGKVLPETRRWFDTTCDSVTLWADAAKGD